MSSIVLLYSNVFHHLIRINFDYFLSFRFFDFLSRSLVLVLPKRYLSLFERGLIVTDCSPHWTIATESAANKLSKYREGEQKKKFAVASPALLSFLESSQARARDLSYSWSRWSRSWRPWKSSITRTFSNYSVGSYHASAFTMLVAESDRSQLLAKDRRLRARSWISKPTRGAATCWRIIRSGKFGEFRHNSAKTSSTFINIRAAHR